MAITTTTGSKDNPTKLSSSSSVTSGDWSGGDGLLPGRETLGPLLLMGVTPAFAILFWYTCAHLEGNFVNLGELILKEGLWQVLQTIWPSPWDGEVWQMIGLFLVFELILQKYWPGKPFEATLTPKGNIPVYTANGFQVYIVTLLTFLTLTYLEIITPYRVYDKFGNILSSMNVFALLFCLMLLIKGHIAPSTTDSGTNNNIVMDYYWGMELYPRIFGWDLKMFTNCRAGLMFWVLGPLCFAHKNMQLNGGSIQYGMAVNVALQLVYLSKFYYWEMGYMCSMDIQHDRAGYYLCWGCLVWVPSIYTSHSFYLATHGPDLSFTAASIIFLAGLLSIWINYETDHQRYVFRQTKGQCTILGKCPPKHIVAQYTTTTTTTSGQQQQQVKTSLLLLDGFWKYSRHFHYVPEILASFFWSLPAWNSSYICPYFYVVYLSILLTDRAFRDDDRCRKKYTKYWDEYCQEVPYMIVPGIF